MTTKVPAQNTYLRMPNPLENLIMSYEKQSKILLEVEGVSKSILHQTAVKPLSFRQYEGEKLAIAGETGSGKTTLLKMIAGLVQPDSGKVLLRGERVLGPLEKLIPGHAHIAYLSQFFELRNNYWVREILEYANELTQKDATALYEVCQISHLVNRRTDQLSGGERQRIALARLLSTSPSLLVLDEPFSHLDALHKSTIKEVIRDIGEQLSISCILVSHDSTDLLSWADTILVMKEGSLIQVGNPETIYRTPVNEYAAGLFGEYIVLNEQNTSELFASMDTQKQKLKIVLRPDELQICDASQSNVSAVVSDIQFRGSYYAITVNVNQQPLIIHSFRNTLAIGEMVHIKLTEQ